MLSTVCARCRPLVATARQVLLSTPAAIPGVRRCYSSTETDSTEDTSADGGQERKNAVIFSGIQPTGIPHLGNYLGAMKQWKRLQDKAKDGDKLLWSIVDLHAITTPQDAEALRVRRREMLAALLAIGLSPEKSHFFYQSSVPQHTELMWILSCTASMGYLSRMTQWKTKLQANFKNVELDDATVAKLKLGLFSYPVLQAADILVHRATHVPVGDDQKQHLEFSRECVRNFNHTFSEVLVPPETITTPSPRVMSLTNPNNKMSKSALNERSRILITAEEREIRQRIMGAVTDMEPNVSWAPWRRPGVANLLELLAQCRGRGRHHHQQQEEEEGGSRDAEAEMKHSPAAKKLADEFEGASLKVLKESVADAVVAELAGVRDRFREVLGRRDGAYVDEVEAMGAAEARKSAEDTMRMVRRVVGLA
ncbi:tryptophanyl-tRNA synthetase [Biscogniauxia sp. FL1348]|nr:tryptophanyl-tRNA synthetase [Biscogniauxia sp. FL1348]